MTTWAKLCLAAQIVIGGGRRGWGAVRSKTSSIAVAQSDAGDGAGYAASESRTPLPRPAMCSRTECHRRSVGDPQQSDPAHTMTKQEESTAMPMAGQANDHSTLAKDPAKK